MLIKVSGLLFDSKITFFVDNDEKLRIIDTGTIQFRNINATATISQGK